MVDEVDFKTSLPRKMIKKGPRPPPRVLIAHYILTLNPNSTQLNSNEFPLGRINQVTGKKVELRRRLRRNEEGPTVRSVKRSTEADG